MEDDFDLKPRLRKLAMIAAGVVALVVVAVVLLTTRSQGSADAVSAKSTGSSSSKWEYNTVLARCSYDKSSTKMICTRVPKGDLTDLNSVLADMSKNGWELVGVSNGTDKGGSMSAFMFKRPK